MMGTNLATQMRWWRMPLWEGINAATIETMTKKNRLNRSPMDKFCEGYFKISPLAKLLGVRSHE